MPRDMFGLNDAHCNDRRLDRITVRLNSSGVEPRPSARRSLWWPVCGTVPMSHAVIADFCARALFDLPHPHIAVRFDSIEEDTITRHCHNTDDRRIIGLLCPRELHQITHRPLAG